MTNLIKTHHVKKGTYVQSEDDVFALIAQIVEEETSSIGRRTWVNSSFGGKMQTVEFELAFGVSASLYISTKYTGEMVEFGDDAKKLPLNTIQCEINWGGTGRSMSEAQASIDLYQKLVSLGTKVEAMFNSRYTVTTAVLKDAGFEL